MGTVSLANSLGVDVRIKEFIVNGVHILPDRTPIQAGTTGSGAYDVKSWRDFDDLIISFYVGSDLYHIDLDEKHYFGGGDYHYPGSGSDVCYTLLGTNTDSNQILVTLGYRQSGPVTYVYSNDFSKNLDKK